MKETNRTALPGEWYQLDRHIYLVVNAGGTVEKLAKPVWWRVLLLAFLNFVGKCKTPKEVRAFLLPWMNKTE